MLLLLFSKTELTLDSQNNICIPYPPLSTTILHFLPVGNPDKRPQNSLVLNSDSREQGHCTKPAVKTFSYEWVD